MPSASSSRDRRVAANELLVRAAEQGRREREPMISS
jgi:hypothetical protein